MLVTEKTSLDPKARGEFKDCRQGRGASMPIPTYLWDGLTVTLNWY
jgi:hypothetical protein